jgi:hypothetical protein
MRKFVAPIVVALIAIVVIVIEVQEHKSGNVINPTAPQIPPGSKLVTIVPNTAGSGDDSLSPFTIPGNAGAWALGWSYNCGSYGDGKGNFIVSVRDVDGAKTSNAQVSQRGSVGDSVSYYYDTGAFQLVINSECDWHIKVTATQPT